jgi:hypothetical protein
MEEQARAGIKEKLLLECKWLNLLLTEQGVDMKRKKIVVGPIFCQPERRGVNRKTQKKRVSQYSRFYQDDQQYFWKGNG